MSENSNNSSKNPLDNFFDLYRFLNPADMSTAIQTMGGDALTKQTTLDLLMNLLLNPNGEFVKFSDIKEKIETAIKDKKGNLLDEEIKKFIHIIGDTGKVECGDSDYWSYQGSSKVNNVFDIIDSKDKRIPTTVVASKSPFLTPGRRGTQALELFLNYMPSIMASRMVPYLEVEFELTRGGIVPGKDPSDDKQVSSGDYLSTPSILRFLMGSGDISKFGSLTEADKALNRVVEKSASGKPISIGTSAPPNPSTHAYSGMELFLMPQTLTNMDTLGASSSRLVPVKPFAPFMSIEDFHVTTRNAGAGAMAHKTAVMKVKIHDKARLSEISEFIRGPTGYSQAVIWTTYGWLAPRTDNAEEDGYAKFINENMMTTDCWQVSNTQFTIDAVGQVTLSLELVNRGVSAIENASIAAFPGSYLHAVAEFKKLTEEITAIKNKILPPDGSESLNAEVRTSQILNAGATGKFLGIEKIQEQINSLAATLKASGAIKDDQQQKLIDDLQKMYLPGKFLGGKSGDGNSYQVLSRTASESVKSRFDVIKSMPDPFLPRAEQKAKDSDKYFGDEIVTTINDFITRSKTIDNDNTEIKDSLGAVVEKIKPAEPVMSFGKLFLNFAVPTLWTLDTCDEIQVIFYNLNDQCGPISGHSIAEFPIDVRMFEYAYRDHLVNNVAHEGNITIQEFLRLVVSNQFNDNRAIGYGMNSFYEPASPASKEEKQVNNFDDKITGWMARHGALKRPVIEMFVETGKSTKNAAGEKFDRFAALRRSQADLYKEEVDPKKYKADGTTIIKRIHIYDKQSNPFKLLSQVINTGHGEWTVGSVNSGKVKSLIVDYLNKNPQANAAQIEDYLRQNATQNAKNNGVSNPQDLGNRVFDYLNVIDKPGGSTIKIGGDKRKVREQLVRTAPNIVIGTNGSMVQTATLASKTDGLIAASNITEMNRGTNRQNGATVTMDGLSNPNNLPLRVVPAQLTMVTKGCPTASMMQQFFIDFGTGTTLDNLYVCTQLQHSISQGKFDTSWTFAFTDGYGKFGGAPMTSNIVTKQINAVLAERKDKADKAAAIATATGVPNR